MSDGAGSSKILTLVFTDLADSTALKAEKGDQAVGALIARHREHVGRLAAESGGRVIDWAGDGCFLTFVTPSAAVLFALRLQETHAEESDLPGVRVGIHMGEVTEGAGPGGDETHPRVEGLAVDLAARVSARARPGQVLLSSAVADSARSRLGTESLGRPIRWRDHGARELKGAGRPLEIVEVAVSGGAPLASPAPTSASAPGTRRVVASVAGVVILVAAVYLVGRGMGRDENAAQPITSLAVLPFENYSGDPDQEYFVDGMIEALIAELAKVKSIKVISRTSAMHYKGSQKPLGEIAGELGVEGIVEGSVTRGGDEVRITAQLIHAATDEHLWAESYTDTLENVLQLQGRVALAITKEIRASLTPEEERRLAKARPVDPAAHRALLKGRHFYLQYTQPEVERAAGYFRKAIELDPGYAAPYAWLSYTHWAPSIGGWGRPDYVIAASLANQALQLDAESARAHTAVGLIAFHERDWKRAEQLLRRASELDPGAAHPYRNLSDLLGTTGRIPEAIAAADRSAELDPLEPICGWLLAIAHMYARDYAAAEKALRGVFELAPDYGRGLPDAAVVYLGLGAPDRAIELARDAVEHVGTPASHAFLAFVLARSGQREAAQAALDRALEVGREHYLSPSFAAIAYGALGDTDEALRWLEQGVEERDFYVLTLGVHPMFDLLRDDPRFEAFVRWLNLPEPT